MDSKWRPYYNKVFMFNVHTIRIYPTSRKDLPKIQYLFATDVKYLYEINDIFHLGLPQGITSSRVFAQTVEPPGLIVPFVDAFISACSVKNRIGNEPCQLDENFKPTTERSKVKFICEEDGLHYVRFNTDDAPMRIETEIARLRIDYYTVRAEIDEVLYDESVPE